MTGALDELEKSYALVQAAKAEVTTRVVAQENAALKVDQVLAQLAAHVESVAGGSDSIITSAGMETKASRSTPIIPSPPQGLTAKPGKHDGEISLSWRAIFNARSYTIDSTTDPANADSWTHVGIATSASKEVTGLKSGTRYWFRVAAVNSIGQSGWSEPAVRVVP